MARNGARSTSLGAPSVIHSARQMPIAGEVLNELPLSPAIIQRPSISGQSPMIGWPSALRR